MHFRRLQKSVICSALLSLFFAASVVSAAEPSVHRGTVLKILRAEGFTYLKCVEQNGTKWVALSGRKRIYPGDVIEYSEVAPLPDAKRRLAGMTFKEVEFAPEPIIYHDGEVAGGAGSPAAGAASAAHNAPDPSQPMSRDEFSQMISKTIEDPEFFKNPFKPGTEIYETYKGYAHDMVSDKAIVDFFYGNFVASYGRVSDYRAYGRALAGETIVHGMLRLSEAEFEDLLRITNRIRGKLPIKDAARVVRDKLKFDIKWLELVSNEDARRYLELTRQSMLAEITKRPAMPVNSEDQRRTALEALMVRIRHRLTQEEQLRYQRILSQPDMAENDEICWAYDVMLGSLFQLPEQPRHWMIREVANMLRR